MIETFDVGGRSGFARARVGALTVLFLVVALWVLWGQTRAPADFPVNSPVVIARGLSAADIAKLLEEEGVVRSNLALYMTLIWKHDPSAIQAGTYIFEEPLSVTAVADRITAVGATENLVALTLPEGYTYWEYASIAEAVLPDFDRLAFMGAVKNKEGYLFPDTYYLPADYTADELEQLLETTYAQKIAPFQAAIDRHPLGGPGVIVLASLLEREANTEESMRMVSGILQNRLREGMRLQVDASIEYVLGRPLNTLTAEDLDTDTPYNTYLYDGLPPTPIGNPGLMAIKAVLEPIESDYFYYLTDSDGNFYYAQTFDEHRANIAKYLR